MRTRAIMREAMQPAKKPEKVSPVINLRYILLIVKSHNVKKLHQKWEIFYKNKLPVENDTPCLSFFDFGLKMLMPLLRFEFAKCLMNVASTLSISLLICTLNQILVSRTQVVKVVTPFSREESYKQLN